MITNDWLPFLHSEKEKPYFQSILNVLKEAKAQGKTIYPKAEDRFNAYSFTPLSQVKVVILGQDPYHGEGQAHGLAFSVQKGVKIPPSLQNIYKELETDIEGFIPPSHGNLEYWAKQGVFLLNTSLSVEAHQAGSHSSIGWQQFTDATIKEINNIGEHVVFILWGSHAQKKSALIDQKKHLVLESPHPSPLSSYRGFLGCKHFSKTNRYLVEHGKLPIDWQIPF